jgi:hypothetical protein
MYFLGGVQRVNAESIDSDKNLIDVITVVDISLSMKDTDPNKYTVDWLENFVEKLDSGSRFGVVFFAGDVIATKEINLTDINDDTVITLKKEINNKYNPIGRGTDSPAALNYALDILIKSKNSGHRQYIVWLTDGIDEPVLRLEKAMMEEREELIKKSQENSIPIYSVGLNFNGEMDIENLSRISRTSGGKAFEIKYYNETLETLDKITSEIISIKEPLTLVPEIKKTETTVGDKEKFTVYLFFIFIIGIFLGAIIIGRHVLLVKKHGKISETEFQGVLEGFSKYRDLETAQRDSISCCRWYENKPCSYTSLASLRKEAGKINVKEALGNLYISSNEIRNFLSARRLDYIKSLLFFLPQGRLTAAQVVFIECFARYYWCIAEEVDKIAFLCGRQQLLKSKHPAKGSDISRYIIDQPDEVRRIFISDFETLLNLGQYSKLKKNLARSKLKILSNMEV